MIELVLIDLGGDHSYLDRLKSEKEALQEELETLKQSFSPVFVSFDPNSPLGSTPNTSTESPIPVISDRSTEHSQLADRIKELESELETARSGKEELGRLLDEVTPLLLIIRLIERNWHGLALLNRIGKRKRRNCLKQWRFVVSLRFILRSVDHEAEFNR